MNADERFMGLALDEARHAMAEGEVPVGAVLVENQKVISRGYNRVEGLKDPTAHAEIEAIRKAAQILDRWRLTKTTLYVTVEPCCMCLGAIILARIERLVFGIQEPKSGFCGSQADLTKTIFNRYGLSVDSGVLADEARDLMQKFFKKLRRGTEVWP
ncbi:MAG: tRNA adenosine(34) deaminase TadA [bacterium]